MSFSRIIKKIKNENNECKILVIGLDNAGKTTIIHKLFGKPVEHIAPTFGYQTHRLRYKDSNIIIQDVGGQSIFREYWNNYYEDVDGIIFVFDIGDRRTFVQYINNIKNDIPNVPMVIYANKFDLFPEFNLKMLGNEFMDYLKKYEIKFLCCSGTQNINLEEGMDWLISKSKKRIQREILLY